MFSCYIAGAKLRGNVFLPAFPPCFFAIGASVRGMALSGPYAGRRNHSAPSKLSALLAAGILLLPATQYPATTWWSKPDLDRGVCTQPRCGTLFRKYTKDEETSRDRPPNPLGDLLPEPVQCHASVRDQLTRISLPEPPSVESTGYEWLILPVNPSASFLSILFANELWFTLGDMTMAEHCAMLSMIFSPRNSGSRMIKRLAEINLVNGMMRQLLNIYVY